MVFYVATGVAEYLVDVSHLMAVQQDWFQVDDDRNRIAEDHFVSFKQESVPNLHEHAPMEAVDEDGEEPVEAEQGDVHVKVAEVRTHLWHMGDNQIFEDALIDLRITKGSCVILRGSQMVDDNLKTPEGHFFVENEQEDGSESIQALTVANGVANTEGQKYTLQGFQLQRVGGLMLNLPVKFICKISFVYHIYHMLYIDQNFVIK